MLEKMPKVHFRHFPVFPAQAVDIEQVWVPE